MEDVPIGQLQAYLRARSAVFHADRSAANGSWHAYYSGPQRRWLKVQRISPTHVRVFYSVDCPCRFS